MRRLLPALAALAVLLAACAEDQPAIVEPPDGADACAKENLPLHQPGVLTIATGNPAYPPWFEGGETGNEWKINDPANGQGFESAVAHAIAEEMGFTADEITWVSIGFNKSFAPGPKDFDFVLQQISYKPVRAEAVDFSESYYDVNQALVSVEGSAVAGATTVEELKGATLGAPIGTTSLDTIQDVIQPDVEPEVYDDLGAAIQDLKSGAIDGVVVDLPSAFYITAVEIPKGVIVGQFPTTGQQEYFALAFEKGNPLVECVNRAIEALKDDGTLAAIQQEWLADKASAPVIAV